MTKNLAQNIWEQLPDIQSTANVSSTEDNELLSLNHKLRALISIVIDNNTSERTLQEITKLATQLTDYIPDLKGDEQVYYAKLYRICTLLCESDND